MKQTWKWTSANLLLLAMIGCNGGEESAVPPAVGPSADATNVMKPMKPATPKSDTAKGEMPLETPPAATTTEPKSDASKKSDEGPKVEGPKAESGAGSPTAEELAAIKELPEAEQAVALKQQTCPVSGDRLGEMGKPFQVTYEGRSFYLCCKSCEPKVKADPKAIIAKLDKKADQK
jgi:YHS domain-containing protein